MEDGGFSPDTMLAATIDFNLMDELLFDGFWLETSQDQSNNFWHPFPSAATCQSSSPSPFCFPEADHNHHHHHNTNCSSPNSCSLKETEELNSRQHLVMNEFPGHGTSTTTSSSSSVPPNSFVGHQDNKANARLWIGPDRNPTSSTNALSVKKKLVQAISRLKDSIGDKDVLVQIWVPVKRGGRQVLTTNNQPFSLNPNCKNLVDYRAVSRNFQFAADEESKEFTGLPGRVFQNKLPEWTPDVRFFRREEYPRVNHAQQYDVRGSVALPVFEQGSGNCLGVVEIVTTSQQVNYRPELETVCKALQEVDLKSFDDIRSAHSTQDAADGSYQAALTEIRNVLKCVCEAHELPLAQTWSPCSQKGKGGCRHSDENYERCVSTIDSACYVGDQQAYGFHEACSEHHLLRGEGIAGKAFLTNQPCFAQDITAFSKTEYPLAHHARFFNLCAAVAIRLRSTYTGTAHDFVLEFFLPLNCKAAQDQKRMLESLSYVIQHTCQSLRVVTDQELAQETPPADGKYPKSTVGSSPEISSWVRHMMDSQQQHKGKGIVSLQDHPDDKEEEEEEMEGGFRVTTQWDAQQNLEHELGSQDTGKFILDSKSSTVTDKRRPKSEKTISLQELRQYFAGSLKDAAKSIGVCPTTLKRICRQHGITRWPSRKIKKVGHSLRKLQLVMDSVQGADGSIQLSSFYNSFPELASSANAAAAATGSSSSSLPTSSKTSDELQQQLNTHPLLRPKTTASKSPSSSGSSSHSHNSSSSYCFSTGANQSTSYPVNVSSCGEQTQGVLLKSDAELQESRTQGQDGKNILLRSYSNKMSTSSLSPPLPKALPNLQVEDHAAAAARLRIKAAFGEEKIVRFSLQAEWGFEELRQEVLKRFNIEEKDGRGNKVDVKYLDDDCEWVLLTCDADLEECIDIHKTSQSRTIKLSVTQSSSSSSSYQRPSQGSSFGST
ncbi:protein NLP5-like [Andrographis paniculata]|uniref:protein NLP5-like n=1 Tax=Andrographis paniculata TaxID=175694 RepID=UPI0021E70A05|nr:protein NLP5-like [Andrographis paniculata]